VKIALVQFNSTVGALEENARRILDTYREQQARGADLVIFPELAVCGYPPRDLLDRADFLESCAEVSNRLMAATGSAGLMYGIALPNHEKSGKVAINVAVLAEGGRQVAVRAKTLLPTYDVFDERRYFAPAASRSPVEWRGRRWGITICEDIWTLEITQRQVRPYGINPLQVLKHMGIDTIVNISASPYSRGKEFGRCDTIRATTAPLGVPVLYCNAVGGNDSLIFDGSSFVLDANGELLAAAESSRETVIFQDLNNHTPIAPPWNRDEIEGVHEALLLGLRDYTRKCGFTDVVVGLSGGIDSAVTAALAAEALNPAHVHTVAMPSRFSSDHSLADAEACAKALGIDHRVIPIEPAHAAFEAMLGPHFTGRKSDTTEENLQARLRGMILMSLSNKFGWLVLSTGNKSEVAVGYSTLYGDTCGGLALIADVPKTLVYSLAQSINKRAGREVIPLSTIEKPPSAELRHDQKDQDTLPPYEVLDPIVEGYVEQNMSWEELVALAKGDENTVRRVVRMVDRNEYKRQQLPPNLRVTGKAFGLGRRMPIAQRFSILPTEDGKKRL